MSTPLPPSLLASPRTRAPRRARIQPAALAGAVVWGLMEVLALWRNRSPRGRARRMR